MKKLIIIGANNFQLPLILKAKEMGIETHVFAWEDGAVGKKFADYFYPISITEKEKILDIAMGIQPDGVISIASDLAIITVNYIAEKLGLIGNSFESTILTTDKFRMREKLLANNLPCPKFFLAANQHYVMPNKMDFPLIAKPTDRSGSRGVTKVMNQTELDFAINRAIEESFNKNAIVEEFIEGKEYSIEMISWQGEHHFIQSTEKETTGSPYFVEKAQHQPANIQKNILDEMIQITKKALTNLGVKFGASHSEFIATTNNKLIITEIGARMGGDYIGSDLVELSTGFDFLNAVINVSLGLEPEVRCIENFFSGTCFVYPNNNGIVMEIIDNSKLFNEVVRAEIYVKKGDIAGEVKESNQRKACYIYKAKHEKFINDTVIQIITK